MQSATIIIQSMIDFDNYSVVRRDRRKGGPANRERETPDSFERQSNALYG